MTHQCLRTRCLEAVVSARRGAWAADSTEWIRLHLPRIHLLARDRILDGGAFHEITPPATIDPPPGHAGIGRFHPLLVLHGLHHVAANRGVRATWRRRRDGDARNTSRPTRRRSRVVEHTIHDETGKPSTRDTRDIDLLSRAQEISR